MNAKMLTVLFLLAMCSHSLAQDQSLKFGDADWRTTGGVTVDSTKSHTAQAGSLSLAPGATAVLKLRDTDGAGKVSFWIYDDATAPADPKARRAGPQWGVVTSDGLRLTIGSIYAPYLAGDTTYTAAEYNLAKKEVPWGKVTYLGVKRSAGWHQWVFDFDADKGLQISLDNKPIKRYDWNKSAVKGFAGVVLVGDSTGGKTQTLWAADIKTELAGQMNAQPTPPPPPPPVVPDKDPALDGKLPTLVNSVMAQHPRVLFGPEDIARMKAFAASPQGKPFIDLMNQYLPTCTPPASPKFLTDATDGQRQGYWRMPMVALHYVLTGDKQSFNNAVGYMKLLASLPHWETGEELDSGMSAANIMVGAALCFDWLYNDLDPAFREQFRKVLLLHARAMYHGGHLMGNPGTHYWQGDPANNHRWHRNAGLTLSILAAYSGAPDEQWILSKTFDDLAYVAKWLPDDGTSHEGPTYAIFGNSHLTLAMAAADRCFGTSYLQQPFFKNAGPFLTQSLLPDQQDLFPFGDAGGGGLSSYAYFLYKSAAVHQQKDVYTILDSAVKRDPKNFQVTAWMPLIWYDPALAGEPMSKLPTRAFFDDLALTYIRDGWTKDSAAAMFKCGPFGGYALNEFRNSNNFKYINVAHDDPDANSFLLWKNGGFLAETDRYSKHKQSSHYNTILINGMGQMALGRPEGGVWSQPAGGNEDMTKMAYITAYKDAGDVVIVEGEAAGSYRAYTDRKTKSSRPDLQRFRRTFIWVQGKYVLTLDDIRAPKSVDVTWLMQGPKLQPVDAKAGVFKLLRDSDSCEFRVVSDQPLSNTIVESGADQRGNVLGWQQLQLSANASAMRLASVYDLWNQGNVKAELKTTGPDQALVTVTGPGFSDTWAWQAAPDNHTASTITGQRAAKPLASISAADTQQRAK